MKPSHDSQPVAILDRVTVARPDGHVILRDLSWTIRGGETWAVVGPIGSGKTTLAETLLGKHFARSGQVSWPILDRLRAAGRTVTYASEVIRHVAFKENSRLFTYAGHYYQQRFEFADEDEPLTLEQYLRNGTNASDDAVHDAARRLGIEHRLQLSFIKLSNGQTRRARIARALLAHPELLILDDPFIGVDTAGRAEVADLLGQLVSDGLHLVLICPPEAVPGWVTNVLECRTPGEERGEKAEGRKARVAASASNSRAAAAPHSQEVIELRNVSVSHGGRAILRDVTWAVRAGERWAVVGPNGSGKTTLLSLLCGDHPQAYSNDIRLFGRQRGTGESIWDVKRRVGLVSPEFHLYFTEPLTAERAAATGFFDAVVDHPTSSEQDAAVRELFEEFEIVPLARRPFRQLSTGEQRLVLLIRALVKRPPLLILDEPFQGLDRATAEKARDWLDRNLAPDQALLFVSHHDEEIPRSVTHRLRLSEGRVVEIG